MFAGALILTAVIGMLMISLWHMVTQTEPGRAFNAAALLVIILAIGSHATGWGWPA